VRELALALILFGNELCDILVGDPLVLLRFDVYGLRLDGVVGGGGGGGGCGQRGF
jgi:hypothetical protein